MFPFETKNKIRQLDLEELAQNEIFECFDNKTILVTGANGLIGSELVLSALCANRMKGLNIKIAALVRNKAKAQKVFGCIMNNPDFDIIVQDINDPIIYNRKVDYIVHTANTTVSAEMVERPVETVLTIVNGTKNVLEFAKEKKPESLCYLSSLEVYGNVISEEPVCEDFCGQIDLTNPRSSYPEGKRLAENLCVSFGTEYGVNAKIVRLAQTFGAGVNKEDNRVFAQFAKAALHNQDIILHTEGNTTRNYCGITDAIIGILTVLIKGEKCQAYNLASDNSFISIKNMAEMIAKKYKINVKHQIDNINRGYCPTVKICLDTAKIKKLGFVSRTNSEEMFEKLIESLKGKEI